MLRLYFENNKPSSDLNSNNIFEDRRQRQMCIRDSLKTTNRLRI